jgi:O-antigen biosynthesis protein WbqP
MNYFVFKRILDVVLASCLLVCLSPIYIVLGIVIRLQDGGPAIFKQMRIGKTGVPFEFYKFRSMPLSTPIVESKDTLKLQITPFGKFIRRRQIFRGR